MAKKVKASKAKAPKVKKGLTPGTVVIQLAGRYKVNGLPLRRVNQKYVIATSTKIDVKAVKSDAVTDKSFAREKAAKDETFGAKKAKGTGPSAERKASQAAVDKALTEALKKQPMLAKYLKARFSLTSGMKPHEMAF